MYSQQLLDYFEHPRNAGDVSNPHADVQLENPACGDILRLSFRVENGVITAVGFRAKGCVPAMGCASALTELIKGKTLDEARKTKREDVIHAVGGLPEASTHAGHLAIDALQLALKNLKL
jgi:NifU-like protein involved in Fe-S cluster formation